VRVDEALQGLRNGETEIVFDDSGPDMCSPEFEIGRQYLFFASGDGTRRLPDVRQPSIVPSRWQARRMNVPIYYTSQCEPNQPAENAAEDVSWLRASLREKYPTRIYGRVLQNRASGGAVVPVGAARVLLEGPAGVLQRVASPDGSFLFENLPFGDYLLRGELPPWLPSPAATVRLESAGCAARPVILSSLGEVSGRATDDRGKPVSGVSLWLYPIVGGKTSDFAWDVGRTGSDGHFHFSEVPASGYVLQYAFNVGNRTQLGKLSIEVGVHGRVVGVEIPIQDNPR
jgi:hypothetical protein